MIPAPENEPRKPVVWLHGRVKTPNGDAMTMKNKKRKALTTAGWRVGEAADVSLDQLVRAYTAAGGQIECQPPRSPVTMKASRLKVAL